MKFAICFFGQPRFLDNNVVQKCYIDLIKKYSADVYLHSWISSTDIKEPLSTSSWVPPVYETKDAVNKLISWLSPKKFRFDSPFTGRLSDYSRNIASSMESYSERNELAILSHLKSIKECVDLIDYPESYDFILVTRYDVMLENFPNLNDIDSKKFYIRHQPNLWWYDAAQLCGGKFFRAFHSVDNVEGIVEYLHKHDRRFYPELFKKRQYEIAGYSFNDVEYTSNLEYAIVRSNDGLNNILK